MTGRGTPSTDITSAIASRLSGSGRYAVLLPILEGLLGRGGDRGRGDKSLSLTCFLGVPDGYKVTGLVGARCW